MVLVPAHDIIGSSLDCRGKELVVIRIGRHVYGRGTGDDNRTGAECFDVVIDFLFVPTRSGCNFWVEQHFADLRQDGFGECDFEFAFAPQVHDL